MTGDDYYHQYAQYMPWYTGQGTTTPTPTPDTGGIARLPIMNQGSGDRTLQGPENYTQTWTQQKTLPGLTQNQLANKEYWQNQKWTPEMAANKAHWENQPNQTINQDPARTGIMKFWDKTKDFFSGVGGNKFSSKFRGTLGDRLSNQPRLPLPAAIASWSLSPFNEKSRNWNPKFAGQLNFLEMGAGNLDANMIGRDPQSGLLKYGADSVLAGKNVISMFGSNNYGVALNEELARMKGLYAKHKKDSQKKKIDRIEQEIAALAENQRKEDEKKRIEAQKNWTPDPQKHYTDKELSQIGRDYYTGPGKAFEQKKSGTFTTPSGKKGYSGGRKEGGFIRSNKALGGILGAF